MTWHIMADRLTQLLCSADTIEASLLDRGPTADQIVSAVHRRRARRHRRRAGLATAVAVVLVAWIWITTQTREPHAPTIAFLARPSTAPQPSSPSPQTLAMLHEQTVARLTHRREPRRPSISSTAAVASPREVRDRAALILIYDADQNLRARRRDDAVAAYRRAIELFPQSRWADVARQRLKQIEQT